jgi:hypothetical protein
MQCTLVPIVGLLTYYKLSRPKTSYASCEEVRGRPVGQPSSGRELLTISVSFFHWIIFPGRGLEIEGLCNEPVAGTALVADPDSSFPK